MGADQSQSELGARIALSDEETTAPTSETDPAQEASDADRDLPHLTTPSRVAGSFRMPAGDGPPAPPEEATADTLAPQQTAAATDSDELSALIARLNAMEGLDPRLKAQVAEDLRQSDPATRPMLIAEFKAMLDQQQPSGSAAAGLGYSADETAARLATDEQVILQSVSLLEAAPTARPSSELAPLPPTLADVHPLQSAEQTQSLAVQVSPPFPSSGTVPVTRPVLLQQPPSAAAVEPLASHTGDTLPPTAMAAATVDESPAAELSPEPPVQSPLRQSTSQTSTVAPSDWNGCLADATRALEAKLQQPEANPAVRRQEEALLRLLYLADDQHHEAIEPIDSWSAADQAFWTHLVQAIHTYLDVHGTPVAESRAQLTLRDLERATGYLSDASRLDVRNLAFCERVESYGRYTEFKANEFAPGQEVLLYVEIENFQADETTEGWVTTIQGSYQIFDENGRRLADYTFPVEKETCRNRRRDFFVPYRLWMPERILPGRYTLQLTIEDTRGNKFGQSSIEFEIVE